MNPRPDYAAEVRRNLVDPRAVCDRLGLLNGATKQTGGGVTIVCPAHAERTPSCSVTQGPDHTLRFRCFGCGASGDALTLVGLVHGLDARTNFREILLEAAQLAGLHQVVDELNDRKPYEPRALPPLPEPAPERDYPPAGDVFKLWTGCGSVADDGASSGLLVSRRLDPVQVARLELAKVLAADANVPSWASYGQRPWTRSGHRMIVPVFDAAGELRSVRAWKVEGDAPAKRLPPTGHRATGLVLANARARKLLTDRSAPRRVVVCEGEPDAICWMLHRPDLAVFGIGSGSWSDDFAKRIPIGSEVLVRTHNDQAGDKYASEIIGTIKTRAVVRRSEAA